MDVNRENSMKFDKFYREFSLKYLTINDEIDAMIEQMIRLCTNVCL